MSSISDKGVGRINEDVLLIAEPVFGVFDGATSLNEYVTSDGKTGGFLAASIARDVFSREYESLMDAAHEANTTLREAMVAAGVDPMSPADHLAHYSGSDTDSGR